MYCVTFALRLITSIIKTTIKASDTLEHQPTVWPVSYACAGKAISPGQWQPQTAVWALLGLRVKLALKGVLCNRLGSKDSVHRAFSPLCCHADEA